MDSRPGARATHRCHGGAGSRGSPRTCITVSLLPIVPNHDQNLHGDQCVEERDASVEGQLGDLRCRQLPVCVAELDDGRVFGRREAVGQDAVVARVYDLVVLQPRAVVDVDGVGPDDILALGRVVGRENEFADILLLAQPLVNLGLPAGDIVLCAGQSRPQGPTAIWKRERRQTYEIVGIHGVRHSDQSHILPLEYDDADDGVEVCLRFDRREEDADKRIDRPSPGAPAVHACDRSVKPHVRGRRSRRSFGGRAHEPAQRCLLSSV